MARCELAGLADAWLVGQEVFWDRFHVVAERTLADTALRWEVIKAARVRLRDHPARLSGLFRTAYVREVARVAGIDEDSRLRAVLRALDGQWVDPGELGYDLACRHIAVVADAPTVLDAVAHRTKRQLLRVRAPDGRIWGWLGGRTRISDGDLEALIASQASSDVRVVFGEPAEGIAGFAVSHHQALEASVVAVAANQRAVRFADFRVLIAVLRDGDLAKGFIERELGELGRPGERMGELRETLRAYLEHSQSVSAAAAVRGRDRKMIERQLRSAEQLIHHRVSDRSDEVLIALRVAEILQHGHYQLTDHVLAVLPAGPCRSPGDAGPHRSHPQAPRPPRSTGWRAGPAGAVRERRWEPLIGPGYGRRLPHIAPIQATVSADTVPLTFRKPISTR